MYVQKLLQLKSAFKKPIGTFALESFAKAHNTKQNITKRLRVIIYKGHISLQS